MIKRKQIYFHNPEKGAHCEDGSKLFLVEYLVPSIATRKGIQ